MNIGRYFIILIKNVITVLKPLHGGQCLSSWLEMIGYILLLF